MLISNFNIGYRKEYALKEMNYLPLKNINFTIPLGESYIPIALYLNTTFFRF